MTKPPAKPRHPQPEDAPAPVVPAASSTTPPPPTVAATEPNLSGWPNNCDVSNRQVRSIERIECAVGMKPWEWLAEFPPKH
ncbi:hypothetical protein NW762_008342 [Fusarium torreyae]|uniref:Uncharacterized protein n=1 Tax=Fusarium torreyae TaxID=1237075 RepID=A0A9W8RYQ7_9HYPO|nr:hypothetical protein NW762_008342 [Fusarium torreyae]